ncbi:lytic murein transglycosylase [Mesorhizobium sp. M8A.F.Ca.ET.173.01.1.1]|nr:lytic murein transglycosylase [Mesorhizobium sp. M8A.F.Ca.ET.173.01.1.1]
MKVTLVRGAPLCPAGHLPLDGGDWRLLRPASFCNSTGWRRPSRLSISPLEGEMAGRPEGGASRQRTL